MPRPQFTLRSLFVLTAVVAVGCLAGPPIIRACQRFDARILVIVIPVVYLLGIAFLIVGLPFFYWRAVGQIDGEDEGRLTRRDGDAPNQATPPER
jgi:hypothetical protein